MFWFTIGVAIGVGVGMWEKFGVGIKTWVAAKWKEHVIDYDPED